MSKSAKQTKSDNPDGELPFEKTMERLEAIVEGMEGGDLPLEKLISSYEEGTRLVATCQQKLAQAELKIQQLEKKSSGELTLKPVELETTSE